MIYALNPGVARSTLVDRVITVGQENLDRRSVVEISVKSLADEAIIEAISERRQDALSELYSRYADLLMSVAVRILKNRSDAEDLIHDVFLEVWNKAGQYDRSRGKVKTWVVLITRSRALDRVRALAVARKHAMAVEVNAEAEPERQRTDPDIEMEYSRIRAAARKLNQHQQAVLYLNYFEGRSCQEISDQLSTPLGTVKSRLRRAVNNLREVFAADGEAT